LTMQNPIYPSHYRIRLRDGRYVEVIDIIEALDLGFNLGNALKYLVRAGRKGGEPRITGLLKAEYYVQREIQNEIEGADPDAEAQPRSSWAIAAEIHELTRRLEDLHAEHERVGRAELAGVDR
jgi:Protein of unknwon function (DUF3310)